MDGAESEVALGLEEGVDMDGCFTGCRSDLEGLYEYYFHVDIPVS